MSVQSGWLYSVWRPPERRYEQPTVVDPRQWRPQADGRLGPSPPRTESRGNQTISFGGRLPAAPRTDRTKARQPGGSPGGRLWSSESPSRNRNRVVAGTLCTFSPVGSIPIADLREQRSSRHRGVIARQLGTLVGGGRLSSSSHLELSRARPNSLVMVTCGSP